VQVSISSAIVLSDMSPQLHDISRDAVNGTFIPFIFKFENWFTQETKFFGVVSRLLILYHLFNNVFPINFVSAMQSETLWDSKVLYLTV